MDPGLTAQDFGERDLEGGRRARLPRQPQLDHRYRGRIVAHLRKQRRPHQRPVVRGLRVRTRPHDGGQRKPQQTETAESAFEQARGEYLVDPEFTMLRLDDAAAESFFADSRALVANYFTMENPAAVRDIGLELYLEAAVGDLTLRGIIDRLELNEAGELIVTDYKTGRPPGVNYEQGKLGGVHFYSFLCEELFGKRPAAIRLMYLRTGETITATPTERSVRFVTTRTQAVWKAVEKACVTGDFRPRQSLLCNSCAFQPWCPAFGGDPQLAASEAPVRFGYAA